MFYLAPMNFLMSLALFKSFLMIIMTSTYIYYSLSCVVTDQIDDMFIAFSALCEKAVYVTYSLVFACILHFGCCKQFLLVLSYGPV